MSKEKIIKIRIPIPRPGGPMKDKKRYSRHKKHQRPGEENEESET